MTRRLLPAVAAAIVAAGLATMGAAAPDAPSADLSNPVSTVTPMVEQYLETGVLPTDVTGDPGIWNYAGPAGECPGLGWNCVTLDAFSLPLTQVGTVNVIQCVGTACVGSTQTGYANTFECQPSADVTSSTNTAVLQECVISQGGTANDAKCVQKKKTVPFVEQRCSITQVGAHNQATIVQVIEQTGGSVQGAVQRAGVSQTATASTNQLQVSQEIKQLTESGAVQDQDAYQVVSGPFEPGEEPLVQSATQTAANGGDNQSQIVQKQIQVAKGGEVQTQNDGATTFTAPEDCDFFFLSPEDPNACANLDQSSGSGHNQSQLTQLMQEEATTSASAVQTQGAVEGGLDGRIHQETSAPGSSQSQADQSKLQKLDAAPGSTQLQFDPAGCCGIESQIGGDGNTEQIDQKSEQFASEDEDAVQELILWGTSFSPPDGTCVIGHDAKNNADSTSESFTIEPCDTPVVVQTTCSNAPVEDGPSILQAEGCETLPPDEVFFPD